ncbi:pentapeptide repeat-containing protein, partial [Peribacillus butanolivorans]|uniref:pentapeptide repeat-containing protein n=1 Tax=Peribacillus butanolivorans TaxID=421767 RepID=UPI0036619EF3
ILAYHRQRALDQANTLVERQHQHKIAADQREHTASTERNLRDRYTTCAEQLAHDTAAIRLAGVYALASLADDWHTFGNNDERQVCIDLLCAYLRTEPPKPRRNGIDTSIQLLEGQEESVAREEQHVRTAIINAIRIRTTPRDGIPAAWSRCEFDLTGANLTRVYLVGADLTGANLSEANLTGASLSYTELSWVLMVGANLSGADLGKANLSGAIAINANLAGAIMTKAKLSDAQLHGATLTGTDLTRANLTNANLAKADFTDGILAEADLTCADLSGASLFKTNLFGANLAEANLRRANLLSACLLAKNLSSAHMSGVYHDDKTIWPDDFDQSRLG